MTQHFEIVRVLVNEQPTWSVLQYYNDQCLGADAHWLDEEHARRARLVYQHHPPVFGDPQDTIARMYWLITGQEF